MEVFGILEEAGLVPAGTASRMTPIVGLRNRIVHLYERIEARRVYEILTEPRNDLREILALLLAAGD